MTTARSIDADAAGTVTVFYEGRELRATADATISAVLAANGILGTRQSAAGERGLFCGMGVCGECAVAIDDGPTRLACMTFPRSGMQIRQRPVRPVMDTESAGVAPGPASEGLLEPEVLVVGGGPAGLAAAAAAAAAGADVLLVDERHTLGGQYYKQPAPSTTGRTPPDRQHRSGRKLIDRVHAAGVRVLTGTRVWGAASPLEWFALGAQGRWTIRPRRIVLATGAHERVPPFPGWTLPGVMTTGAGQGLQRAYRVKVGSRVLVAGNGPLNVQLAAELVEAGASVVALVELAAVVDPRRARWLASMAVSSPALLFNGVGHLARLRLSGVPQHTRSAVIRVDGHRRAEIAVVARIDGAGRPVPGTERRYEVDAVCVGMGFLPGAEAARWLGAAHDLDATGGYRVRRSDTFHTSIDNVWAVGDGACVEGARVAQASGELAGAEVAKTLGYHPDTKRVRSAGRGLRRHRRFQRALWSLYRAPELTLQLTDPETIICRCESVTLERLEANAREVLSASAAKRLTRCGMGYCQGRFCSPAVAAVVAGYSGKPSAGSSGFTAQVPFRPTSLGALAAPGRLDPHPVLTPGD
jgi:thioredoxin reductase